MSASKLPLTRDELIASPMHNTPRNFLLFWGHTPRAGATSVGKECLSQWYPAPFEIEGRHFPTAEHYMMWRKAVLFGDDAAVERVLVAKTPADAKLVGRDVRGFDDALWVAHRMEIVVTASVAKFRQNAELLAFLLATEEKILIEASPRDCVWGIGLGADNPRAADARTWRGENLLGFALMRARAELAS